MSKIGVGVGDEFPADDGSNRNAQNAGSGTETPRDDRAEFEEWKRRRDAYRAQREQWHAQREEWRRRRAEWKDQWRAQRHAWREEARASQRDGVYSGAHGDYGYAMGGGYGRGHIPYFFGHRLARLLAFLVVIALIVFAFSHIGLILVGLVAIGALFVAYHHFGHDPFDIGPRRDYARPVNNPPPAPTPTVEKPRDPAA